MANEIDLLLGVDDAGLIASLDKVGNELLDVQRDATRTGNAIDAAFKEGTKSVDAFNKEIAQTEQQVKKASKNVGLIGKAYEAVGKPVRQLRVAFAASFQSIASGITTVIDGFKSFNAVLNPTFALQQRINGAIGQAAESYADQKRELSGLFGLVKSTTTGDVQRREAIARLNEEYGKYLPNLLTEKSSLQEIEAAQQAANKGIIRAIALKAQEAEQTRIVGELAQSNAELKRLEALATVQGFDVFGAATAGTLKLEKQRNQSLQAQLKNVGNVGKEIESILLELDASLIESNTDLGASFDKTSVKFRETAKELSPLKGSLSDLEKQLEAVNKKINEQVAATDKAGLMPLIDQAKQLETQIAAAKTEIDKLFGRDGIGEAERKAKELELVQQLLLSQEDIEINAAITREQARKEEINKIVQDEKLKADLLKANEEQTQKDTEAIQQRFAQARQEKADSEQNVIFEARQRTLEQQIAQSEAELRQKQAADNLLLQQTKASEEQVTQVQAEQERERQRLALESEKKRLELVLQFSKGRSDAEIAATKATIAAIENELAGLNATVTEQAQSSGRKSVFEIFGLSSDTPEGKAVIEGIQSGISTVTSQLQELFNRRVELANQAVEARDNEISRLQDQLELELQLNEQGFASKVQLTQKQLESENAAREKALAQQRKAVAAQQALETIIQAVNLITAASNIFSALSPGFPYTLPLAIATVAAMAGSFIAFKAQAFKATKLYDGGQIPTVGEGGRSDKNGGAGHRIEGTNLVVGGGEFVTNAQDTAEQLPVLKAINNGQFRGVDVMDLLSAKTNKAKSLGVKTRTVERIKQRKTDKAIIKAIEAQTSKQMDKFNKLINKPMLAANGENYVIMRIDEFGNTDIKKVNTK